MSAGFQNGCKHCNRSGLSLLLLRPSPVVRFIESGLVPLGAKDVKSDDTLTAGLLPARKPTESRFVLRLLREGYVYIHIPNPPQGYKKDWLVYRVTDNANMIAEDNALFSQQPYQACSAPGHNNVGMHLVEIPQAHLLIGKPIWIAYSANLWSKELKGKNAAEASTDREVRAEMAAKTEKKGGVAVKTKAETQALLNIADETERMLDKNAAAAAQSVQAYQAKDYVAIGKWLAVGTMMTNAIGLWLCLSKIQDSQDANEIRYAWFGVGDSTAGIVGGLLELWAISDTGKALKAATPGTTSELVTAHSGVLTGLRMGVALAGAVAGILNGYVNWAKSGNAKNSSDIAVAYLYWTSGSAFHGTAVTSTGVAASLWLVRAFGRVEEGAAVRAGTRAIVRFAVRRGGTAAGAAALGLTLTGVGWALLAAGLIFEAGAIILTPTDMQKWARRTRFGQRKAERFKSWEEEEKAFNQLLAPAK